MKRFGYINRRSSYGSSYALEMLENVLVASAFEQDVSVMFLDDGVYQITKHQDTSAIGHKNFSPTFRALADYDVEKIYVEASSLAERGLTVDDLLIDVTIVSSAELAEILHSQDVLVNA